MQAHLYINGYIGDIFGGEYAFNVSHLQQFLQGDGKEATEIVVHINSGGGSVTEGFAIYDLLKASGKKIITQIEGMCGSIATIIALAGSERKMFQNSEWFIHNPLWVPGFDMLTADELESITADLRKAEVKILDFYEKNTKATREDLQAKMEAQTFLTSDEALAMGFITEVIKTDTAALVKYKIAACVDTDKIKNEKPMSKKLEDLLNAFSEKMDKVFAAVTKGKIANAVVTTDDGKSLYCEGDLAVGVKVYLDEAMTEAAPDGDHKLSDGRTITTVGGEVTAIAEAMNDEVANLKAQVATLTESNEKLTAELATKAKETETQIANITNIQNEFAAFKKEILTGSKEGFEPEPNDPKAGKQVAVKGLDKAAEKANKILKGK